MPSYGSWESTNKMNNLEANAGRKNFGRGFSFGEIGKHQHPRERRGMG